MKKIKLELTEDDITEVLCAIDILFDTLSKDSPHREMLRKIIAKINRQWSNQE